MQRSGTSVLPEVELYKEENPISMLTHTPLKLPQWDARHSVYQVVNINSAGKELEMFLKN